MFAIALKRYTKHTDNGQSVKSNANKMKERPRTKCNTQSDIHTTTTNISKTTIYRTVLNCIRRNIETTVVTRATQTMASHRRENTLHKLIYHLFILTSTNNVQFTLHNLCA